jgi:hypothetical protein
MSQPLPSPRPLPAAKITAEWIERVARTLHAENREIRGGPGCTIQVLDNRKWHTLMLSNGQYSFINDDERDSALKRILNWKPQ